MKPLLVVYLFVYLTLTGYVKLKPYGFPIHGAIDGFSRRILWLEVARSNNNPKVAATFYLNQVKEMNGCLLQLISDCGTENGIAASMQCFFRQNGNDELAGEKSHKYCSSPSNQRIEAWWSFLRRHRSNWWINLFKDMIENDIIDLGNEFHVERLWFCFSRVLQNDLDKVKEHCNSHKVSKSPYSGVHGVPYIMYFLPVSQEQVDEMEEHCKIQELEDNIYREYFLYVLETEGLAYPSIEEHREKCLHMRQL